MSAFTDANALTFRGRFYPNGDARAVFDGEVSIARTTITVSKRANLYDTSARGASPFVGMASAALIQFFRDGTDVTLMRGNSLLFDSATNDAELARGVAGSERSVRLLNDPASWLRLRIQLNTLAEGDAMVDALTHRHAEESLSPPSATNNNNNNNNNNSNSNRASSAVLDPRSPSQRSSRNAQSSHLREATGSRMYQPHDSSRPVSSHISEHPAREERSIPPGARHFTPQRSTGASANNNINNNNNNNGDRATSRASSVRSCHRSRRASSSRHGSRHRDVNHDVESVGSNDYDRRPSRSRSAGRHQQTHTYTSDSASPRSVGSRRSAANSNSSPSQHLLRQAYKLLHHRLHVMQYLHKEMVHQAYLVEEAKLGTSRRGRSTSQSPRRKHRSRSRTPHSRSPRRTAEAEAARLQEIDQRLAEVEALRREAERDREVAAMLRREAAERSLREPASFVSQPPNNNNNNNNVGGDGDLYALATIPNHNETASRNSRISNGGQPPYGCRSAPPYNNNNNNNNINRNNTAASSIMDGDVSSTIVLSRFLSGGAWQRFYPAFESHIRFCAQVDVCLALKQPRRRVAITSIGVENHHPESCGLRITAEVRCGEELHPDSAERRLKSCPMRLLQRLYDSYSMLLPPDVVAGEEGEEAMLLPQEGGGAAGGARTNPRQQQQQQQQRPPMASAISPISSSGASQRRHAAYRGYPQTNNNSNKPSLDDRALRSVDDGTAAPRRGAAPLSRSRQPDQADVMESTRYPRNQPYRGSSYAPSSNNNNNNYGRRPYRDEDDDQRSNRSDWRSPGMSQVLRREMQLLDDERAAERSLEEESRLLDEARARRRDSLASSSRGGGARARSDRRNMDAKLEDVVGEEAVERAALIVGAARQLKTLLDAHRRREAQLNLQDVEAYRRTTVQEQQRYEAEALRKAMRAKASGHPARMEQLREAERAHRDAILRQEATQRASFLLSATAFLRDCWSYEAESVEREEMAARLAIEADGLAGWSRLLLRRKDDLQWLKKQQQQRGRSVGWRNAAPGDGSGDVLTMTNDLHTQEHAERSAILREESRRRLLFRREWLHYGENIDRARIEAEEQRARDEVVDRRLSQGRRHVEKQLAQREELQSLRSEEDFYRRAILSDEQDARDVIGEVMAAAVKEMMLARRSEERDRTLASDDNTWDNNTSGTPRRRRLSTPRTQPKAFHYLTFLPEDMDYPPNAILAIEGMLGCSINRNLEVVNVCRPLPKATDEDLQLQAGDMILDVAGHSLHSLSHLREVLANRAMQIQEEARQEFPGVEESQLTVNPALQKYVEVLCEHHNFLVQVLRGCDIYQIIVRS